MTRDVVRERIEKIRKDYDEGLPLVKQNSPSVLVLRAYDGIDEKGLTTLANAVNGNTILRELVISPPKKIRTARAMAKAIRRSRLTHLTVQKIILPPWLSLNPPTVPRPAHAHALIMETLYLEGIKWSYVRKLDIDCDVGDLNALNSILPCLSELSLSSIDWRQFDQLQDGLRSSSLGKLRIGKLNAESSRLANVFGTLGCTPVRTLEFFRCTFFRGFFDGWTDTATQFKELVLDHSNFEMDGTQLEEDDDEIPVLHATVNHRALESFSFFHYTIMSFPGLEAVATLLASNALTLKHLALNTALLCPDIRREASKLFLQCVQSNTHLHTLSLPEFHLELDKDESKFNRAIQFYLAPNRLRSFLTSEDDIPPGIWLRVLAFYKHNPSCVCYILHQQPGLVTFV
jgi:hypothetical protein